MVSFPYPNVCIFLRQCFTPWLPRLQRHQQQHTLSDHPRKLPLAHPPQTNVSPKKMAIPRCTSAHAPDVSLAGYGERNATSPNPFAAPVNTWVSSVSISVQFGGSIPIEGNNRRRSSKKSSGTPRWSRSPHNKRKFMPKHMLPPRLPRERLPASTLHLACAIPCPRPRHIPICSQGRGQRHWSHTSPRSLNSISPKTSSTPRR